MSEPTSRYRTWGLFMGGALTVFLLGAGASAGAPQGAQPSPEVRASRIAAGKMNIRRLADASTAYFEQEHADRLGNLLAPQFPRSVAVTPAKSCCQQGGRCEPGPNVFSDPTWMALNFSVDDPDYFQYEYRSSGKGKDATFVVRAIGELDCHGHKTIIERSGHVGDDLAVVLTPIRIVE